MILNSDDGAVLTILSLPLSNGNAQGKPYECLTIKTAQWTKDCFDDYYVSFEDM